MKSYSSTLTMVGLPFKSTGISLFSFRSFFTLAFVFIYLASFAGENLRIPVNLNTQSFSLAQTSSPLAGPESIRTNLYLLQANNALILADGVLTEYNNLYHDSVLLEDAYKFTNINENLGISRYGYTLAVERRPIIANADTLFFKLWKTTRRNYQLEFVTTNLDHPGMQAYLEDTHLATNTPLALNGTTKINFTINTDAGSSNISRFRVIYKTLATPAPLPVTFTSVKGYQVKSKVTVDWKVENEINLSKYEVERSVNGIDFTSIGSVNVISNRSFGTYSQIDDQPVTGTNFYRVKSVDRDGSKKYSLVVKVNTVKAAIGSISIYPNPIKGNMVNLRFVGQPAGVYQVRMISNTGQMVYMGKMTISSDNTTETIYTAQKLSGGIYQLEIKAPDNTVQVQKAIVQE